MSKADSEQAQGSQASSTGEARGDRLQQLRRLGVRKGRAGLSREAASSAQQALVPFSGRDPASGGDSLENLVGAVEVVTPYGSCLVAESRYVLTESRGGWPLAAALACSGPAVAACSRDSRLTSFDMGRAAFLDTETSGLSGGAGTFAFMVGIGTFETAPGALEFVVRQVFMRHPGEERALLHVVEGMLARCTGLISFNGRAFDVPLLANRYLLQRQPSPLESLGHLDLLPPARQRWRLLLPSCALGSLEQEILRYRRSQEDVPGWLIPSIYQEYARGGAAGEMARVFYHNQEDIVSMVFLAAILCAPFEGQGTLVDPQDLQPVEMVALGRCFETLGWLDAGELAYRQALAGPLPDEARTLSLLSLGWLLKRQERRMEAVEVWQQWITSVPGSDPIPYEELAKHYEWHEIDLEAARKWAMWGLHTVRQMPAGPRREQSLAALQHRLDRLERKLAPGGVDS